MNERGLPLLTDTVSRFAAPNREVESFCQALTGEQRDYHGCARQLVDDLQSIRRIVNQVFWLEARDTDTC